MQRNHAQPTDALGKDALMDAFLSTGEIGYFLLREELYRDSSDLD